MIGAERPVVGVGVVVLRGDDVLLIRRGEPPRKDRWSIPGGKQERGETVRNTAHREIREETGVEIALIGLVDVVDGIRRDETGATISHYTLIDFAAEWVFRRAGRRRRRGGGALDFARKSGRLQALVRDTPDYPPARPRCVMMRGIVKAALTKLPGRQRPADQNERAAGKAGGFYALAYRRKRAGHDQLVRLAGAIDDGGRAVFPQHRRERADDIGEIGGREVDRQCAAAPRLGGKLLSVGHGRCAHGGPGESDRLGDVGHGELDAQRGRGGGEGRHARSDRVVDPQPVETAYLFCDCAIQRRVSRMHPRHIPARTVRRNEFGFDLIEGHRCRVEDSGIGARLGDHVFRHQRAGIEHHRRGADQCQAAHRYEIRRAGARTDEMHGHDG